jgi:hypothetical protein
LTCPLLTPADTNILRWAEIQQLGSASPSNLQCLKDWVLFHKSLGVLDKRPWLRSHPTELLVLSPELDRFDHWLAGLLIPLWHRLIGERWKNRCFRQQGQDLEAQPAVYRYSPQSFVLLGNICCVLISSAVLVCSVVVLSFTTTTPVRLAFVSAFTVLFAAILMFVARCRRFEVFAGTATFCAVLIVFFQGVQSCGGS